MKKKKMNLHFFSRRFLLVRSHTTLVAGTQSSTPSSIIFINVTFLLQQQKTNQNETDRIYLAFSFLQRRKRVDEKNNFLDCKFTGVSAWVAQRQVQGAIDSISKFFFRTFYMYYICPCSICHEFLLTCHHFYTYLTLLNIFPKFYLHK